MRVGEPFLHLCSAAFRAFAAHAAVADAVRKAKDRCVITDGKCIFTGSVVVNMPASLDIDNLMFHFLLLVYIDRIAIRRTRTTTHPTIV